jgi:YebC/PmpR family DNA-binding regulatory protein
VSGHSKWHNIAAKKEKTDAQRAKVFTKLSREIIVCVREGGPNPDSNGRLKDIIAKARASNVPSDNINRVIARAVGSADGGNYESINYEGYGPGGAAIFMRVLTDNRNRTVAELRHVLSKHGGNLGESGCVAWMFERKGYFVVEKAAATEEKLFDLVIGNGGDDLKEDGDNFEIFCAPEGFEPLKAALEAAAIPTAAAEVSMVPQNYVKLEGKEAQSMLKLMEALEDQEDIQNVWSNFDVDESAMQEAS